MKSVSLGTKLIVNGNVIGGLKRIDGFKVEGEEVDLTSLDTEGGYREKETTFLSVGDVEVGGFLDGDVSAGQTSMFALLEAHTIVPCEIRFPAKIGLSYYFNASVKNFSTSVDLEGGVEFSASLLPNKGGSLRQTGTAGPDCSLSALTIGSVALSPTFDADVTEYTATTSNATNTITATATSESAGVVIVVNGNSLTSGSAATWKAGENEVKITVTNGANIRTYTVIVTKE